MTLARVGYSYLSLWKVAPILLLMFFGGAWVVMETLLVGILYLSNPGMRASLCNS